MNQLQNGDQFPDVSGTTVNHGTMFFPQDLDSEWVTLLYYRGEW
jgi:hypothetical protein